MRSITRRLTRCVNGGAADRIPERDDRFDWGPEDCGPLQNPGESTMGSRATSRTLRLNATDFVNKEQKPFYHRLESNRTPALESSGAGRW